MLSIKLTLCLCVVRELCFSQCRSHLPCSELCYEDSLIGGVHEAACKALRPSTQQLVSNGISPTAK